LPVKGFKQSAQITFVSLTLAFHLFEQGFKHLVVVISRIARSKQKIHDLAHVVNYQMQFETKKPVNQERFTSGGFTPLGNAFKDPVRMNAAIVTDNQFFGVNKVKTGLLTFQSTVLEQ
jgi:hypothetical protein